MKQRKAERFLTAAEEQDRLRASAAQAAAFFARTGGLLPCWNNRRVTGAMIALGLASHAELDAARLNVPAMALGEAGLGAKGRGA